MRLSTTQLKLFTGLCMLVCLCLFLRMPAVLATRPLAGASTVAKKQFAIQMFGWIGIIVFCLIGAGVAAIAISRRAAAEYRLAQMDNMRELIEASLADQKQGPDEPGN